jgi:hypothetical protein
MHLKIAGVDSTEFGMHTVLMHLLSQLLMLSDAHMLIERQLAANLIMATLLRCRISM